MIRRLLTSLVIVALLSGCGSPVPSGVTIENSEISASPESHATQTEDASAPDWTQPPSPSEVDACRVIDGQSEAARSVRAGTPIHGKRSRGNIGFPLSPQSLPIEGEAKLIVVMVAFQDAPPSNQTPEGFLRPQLERMTQWSEYWSQGKFTYSFQLVNDWVKLPVNHADYPVAGRLGYEVSQANANEVIKLVTAALPPDLDYEGIDGVLAYWAPGIFAFEGDLALRGHEGVLLPFPDGEKQVGFWSGNRYHVTSSDGMSAEVKSQFTWSFWIYLMLFAKGLHNHAPGNGWPVGLQQMQESSGKFSGAMNGWDVFKLGWLQDSQVHCMDPRDFSDPQEFILQSREVAGGERRIGVVPLEEKGAIVIESRRPVGWSEPWGEEDSGLLVYFVDTKLDVERIDEQTRGGCGPSPEQQKWAYFLYADGFSGDCRSFSNAFIKQGQAVTFEGVRIELVHSDLTQDFVRVTNAG